MSIYLRDRTLAWWHRHAPDELRDYCAERERFTLDAVHRDLRIKADPRRRPPALAVALLARQHGMKRTAVQQLIREGKWWDSVEERAEKQHGIAALTMRACNPNPYQPALDAGRRLLGRRGGRLTREQAETVWSLLPTPMTAEIFARINQWVAAEAEARKRRVSRANFPT